MKKTALILGFLVMFAASTAFANHGGKFCPMGGGKACKGMSCASHQQESPCPIVNTLLEQAHAALEHSKDLGLTAEQIQGIREIKIEAKKHNIRMKAEMEIMQLDMKVMLKSDTFDAEAAKAMMEKGMPGMMEGGKKVIDWYGKFRSILKPEQWEKLKEIR